MDADNVGPAYVDRLVRKLVKRSRRRWRRRGCETRHRIASRRESHATRRGHHRSATTRAGPDDDGPAEPEPPRRFPLTFACLPPEARS